MAEEFSFEDAGKAREFTFDEAKAGGGEFSFEEAQAELKAQPKEASWYETISSIPERVVQGTRAIMPNFENMVTQEELAKRKVPEQPKSLWQQIDEQLQSAPINPAALLQRGLELPARALQMLEPTDSLEARARLIADTAEAANKRLQEARPEGESTSQQVVGGAFESLGPGLGAVALMAGSRGSALPQTVQALMATGAFSLASGGGYAAEAGGGFQEAIERGATVPEAARSGRFAGEVSAGLSIAMPAFAGKAGGSLATKIAETAGANAGEEFLTAFTSGVQQKFAWDPNRPWSEILKDSSLEALGGIIGGTAIGPISKAGDVVGGGRYTREQMQAFRDIAREIENGTILTDVPPALAPHLEQYGTMLVPDTSEIATGAPSGSAIVIPPWQFSPGLISPEDMAKRWEIATDNMDSDRAEELIDEFEAALGDGQKAIDLMAEQPEKLAAAVMLTGRDPVAKLKEMFDAGTIGPAYYQNFVDAFNQTLADAYEELDSFVSGQRERREAANARLVDMANENLDGLIDDRPELDEEIRLIREMISATRKGKPLYWSSAPKEFRELPFTKRALRDFPNNEDKLTQLLDYLEGRKVGKLLPSKGSYSADIDAINTPLSDGTAIEQSKKFAAAAGGFPTIFSEDGEAVPVTYTPGMALPEGSVGIAFTGDVDVDSTLAAARDFVLRANKQFGLKIPVLIYHDGANPLTGGTMSSGETMAVMKLNLTSQFTTEAGRLSTVAHEYAHHVAAHLIASNPIAARAMQNQWRKMVFEYLRDPRSSTEAYERAVRGTPVNPWGGQVSEKVVDALFSRKSNATNYIASLIEWLAHQGERAVESIPELQGPEFKKLFDVVRQSGKDLKQLLPSEAYQAFIESRAGVLSAHLEEANRQAMYTIGAHLLLKAPNSPMAQAIMERALADEAGIPQEEINTVANPSPDLDKQLAQPLQSMVNWGAPGKPQVNLTAGSKAIGLDLDRFNRVGSKWQGLLQLAWRNPHISSLRMYVEGVMEHANTRMKWMSRANATLKEFHKLGAERIDQLTRFMLEETNREAAFNLSDPVERAYVKQAYPLLDDKAMAVYKRVRADFIDFMRAVGKGAEDAIRKRLANDPVQAAAEVLALRKRMATLVSKPYFPMSRFGSYMVYLRAESDMTYEGRKFKAGDLVGVFNFETESEQKKFAAALAKQNPQHSVTARMATEMEKTLVGMNPVLIEAMANNLGLNEAQRAEMQQFLLKVAPAMSWTKHLMQRKKTLGYSLDGARAFADYFVHGSNHLARMLHADGLRETIELMKQEELSAQGRPGQPVDTTKRSMIRQWVMDHFDYIMNPREEWAKARAVVAISYLAGSLRAAWVNLTQTLTYTFPYLAAQHGDAKATAAITRQFKNASRLYKMISGMTQSEELILQKYLQGDVMTENEKKILAKRLGGDVGNAQNVARAIGLMKGLQLAVQQGFLDESNATELAAMSEGGWMYKSRASSKMGYYGRSLSHALMYPFQEAEKLNRRVAFAAAYELAYDQSGDEVQAFAAAKEAVFRTQFEYSKWNRAPALRGRKGLALMFWQYKLNALAQLTSDRSFFWRATLMQVLLAGSLGLPFAENLLDLIDWILERINPNRRGDSRYEIQKHLEEHFSFWGADVALHGLTPLSGVDISGSMSMGQFLPFTDVLFGSQGLAHGVANWLPGEDVPVLDFKDLVQRTAEDSGGAAVALTFRVLKGLTSNDPDKVANALRMNPITFLRDAMEATHMALEGQAKSASGVPIAEFDLDNPRHTAELIARGMGFQPTALRTGRRDEDGDIIEGNPGRDLNWLIQRQVAYYQTRRQMLISGFSQAYINGDDEALDQVNAHINAYNEEVGRFGLGIKRDTIRASIRRRLEEQALAREGLRGGSRAGLASSLRGREF